VYRSVNLSLAWEEMQSFSAPPKAVGSKNKYRDYDDGSGNMMHDKRIVRGNTYAAVLQPEAPDMAQTQKQREAQRRRLMRANQTKKRVGTPEPIAGRKHMDIQTDSYLEELTERTVEFEAETQTDFLLDRPPSPLFMPAKIGIDCATEILDGELFDFDVEVEPVLEVLVGKTLEQGMMEVLEEEELASLQRHQEDFEKRRNAELLEVQRMEAAEKRRSDEMERRMQQQAAQKEVDLSSMRKVASRSIAAAHLSSLQDRVLAHLFDAGVFASRTEEEVQAIFLPQLLNLASQAARDIEKDKQRVENLVKGSAAKLLAGHGNILAAERRRLEALEKAEREARREREEHKKIKEENDKRIQREQAKMRKWEAKLPKPKKVVDHEIKSFDGDNVLLADGRVVRNFAEGLSKEDLAELVKQLNEDHGERAVVNIETDPEFQADPDVDPTVAQGSKVTKSRKFRVNDFHLEIIGARGLKDEPVDAFVVVKDVDGLIGDERKTEIVKQSTEPEFGFQADLRCTFKLAALEFEVRDAQLATAGDGPEDLSVPLLRCELPVDLIYESLHTTPPGEAIEVDLWLEASERQKEELPHLSQGQLHVKVSAKFNIPVMLPGMEIPLPRHFQIGLAWSFIHEDHPVDLDASLVGLTAQEKEVDQVWYQKLVGFDGAVKHSGDDRSGEGDGDDETLFIDLDLMPKSVEKLAVCINSYDEESLDKCIKFAYARLIVDGTSAGFFSLGEGFVPPCTGIFLGSVRKKTDGNWIFRPTGTAANGATVQESLPAIIQTGKEMLGW